jgi:hypothetical protein
MSKLADHHSRITQTEIRSVLPAFFHTEISCSYRNLAPKSQKFVIIFPLTRPYIGALFLDPNIILSYWVHYSNGVIAIWQYDIKIFNNPIVISVPIYFHPFDLLPSLLVDAGWSPHHPTRSGGAAKPKDSVRFPTRMRQRAQKCKRSWWLWCHQLETGETGETGSVLVLEQKGRDQNLDHMTGGRNIQLYQLS